MKMKARILTLITCAGFLFTSCYPELAHAQTYSLIPNAILQYSDNAGAPLSGGKLYTCVAGSTCPGTPQASYADSSGTPNANPVILDSGGRATVYLSTAACYKLVLQTSAGVTLKTQDNVCAALSSNISGAIVDTTSVQTLQNKIFDNTDTITVKDNLLTLQANTDTTKQLRLDATGITTGTTRTLTSPDANTTIVGTDATQTLTNKVISVTNTLTAKDSTFTVVDDGDNTKKIAFEASGITTATTRTLTAPDASGTLVLNSNTQTLTNKTLTTPSISSLSNGRSRICSVPIGSVAYASLGTDTTPVSGTTYWAEVWLPANMTITGVSTLNGSAAANSVNVAIYAGANGSALANSALAGTAESGTNAFQDVPFTGTYPAVGPARYYVGIQYNGTSARFRTVAASTFVDVLTTSATGTFGTFPALTVPTTFTAGVGPIACFY